MSIFPGRFRRMQEALDRRQPDLTVVMEGVHKPHNFSAVIRTADAVGLLEVHAVVEGGNLRPQQNVAKGAHRYTEIRAHRDTADAIDELGRRGFRMIALDPSDDGSDFREIDYTVPTALILGEERTGLSDDALGMSSEKVRIPMEGLGASLNVSVAAALVLFEAQRQRRRAGLYDQPRVSEAVRRKILFEWAHPGFARLCRDKGIAYPELDDEGNLIEVPWRTGC